MLALSPPLLITNLTRPTSQAPHFASLRLRNLPGTQANRRSLAQPVILRIKSPIRLIPPIDNNQHQTKPPRQDRKRSTAFDLNQLTTRTTTPGALEYKSAPSRESGLPPSLLPAPQFPPAWRP